jgi:hypothetical protein
VALHNWYMPELKTLYWTHGHVKRGIISLAKDGIVVYHTEAKLDLTDENLRDVIYANVNFKNIVDIGIEFTFLRGKVLFLILEEKVFEKVIEGIPKPLRSYFHIKKRFYKLLFEVNVDARDEILDFIEKAEKLMRKNK